MCMWMWSGFAAYIYCCIWFSLKYQRKVKSTQLSIIMACCCGWIIYYKLSNAIDQNVHLLCCGVENGVKKKIAAAEPETIEIAINISLMNNDLMKCCSQHFFSCAFSWSLVHYVEILNYIIWHLRYCIENVDSKWFSWRQAQSNI